jgi:Fe-S cluster biosynthesis and repair protein YggX
MANDSCEPTPVPSEPVKPGTRMVHCVKFDKDLPGLDRVPWKGELGKRVYENVSKDAWKLWVEYSKMVMNEYRLNPLDPNSQKIMEEQMEQFFFGEGAKLPEGYVPPKAKGGDKFSVVSNPFSVTNPSMGFGENRLSVLR